MQGQGRCWGAAKKGAVRKAKHCSWMMETYIQFLLCTVQSLSSGSSIIDGFVLAISRLRRQLSRISMRSCPSITPFLLTRTAPWKPVNIEWCLIAVAGSKVYNVNRSLPW